MMNIRLNAAQKGALQLAENTLVAGIITGALAVLPDLSGAGPINWPHALNVFGIAMFFAVLNAVIVAVKVYNMPLGAALGADVAATQTHYDGSKGPVWLPPAVVSTATTFQPITQPASLVTIHVAQPAQMTVAPPTPDASPGASATTPSAPASSAAPTLPPLPTMSNMAQPSSNTATATAFAPAIAAAALPLNEDTMPRAAVGRIAIGK